jgi:hypothetical protein
MTETANKFTVAKGNIGNLVEKNDVGIIRSKSGEITSIFFIRIGKVIMLGKDDFKVFNVKRTGDSFSKKICNVCHKLKNTSEFSKNQNAKNNRSVRRPSCGNCRKIIEGIELSKSEKDKWLKTKPINEPFDCPICKKRTIAGVTSKVVLEHDHHTGKARAWVCDSCNTGIGRFKDDTEILRRAIKFLKIPPR